MIRDRYATDGPESTFQPGFHGRVRVARAGLRWDQRPEEAGLHCRHPCGPGQELRSAGSGVPRCGQADFARRAALSAFRPGLERGADALDGRGSGDRDARSFRTLGRRGKMRIAAG